MTTTSTPETTSIELGHYLAVLRRRAWVLVLFVLLGLLGAVLYLSSANRQVTATTTLDVSVISSDPFRTQRSAAELLNAETEKQLVSSSAVLQQVSDSLGADLTAKEVRRRMAATLLPNATIMRISYTAGGRAEAEHGADTIAATYLAFRSAQADTRVTTIADELNRRRDSLRADLIRSNTTIRDAPPGSARALRAEADRQLADSELDALSGQISSFLALDTRGGTVLTAAGHNPIVAGPSRRLVIGTGLAAGLLAGIMAAFVLNATGRRP